MRENDKKFITDSLITITRQVTNIIIGVLLLVVLARLLGPSGQGTYSIVTLLPLILMMFVSLGINTSTIFYVSKEKYSLETVIKTNIVFAILLSIVAIIIGFIVIYFFSTYFFDKVNPNLLYLSLFSLPFIFLREFLQTVFHGLQDFKSYNSLMIVNQFATLIFIILFSFIINLGISGAIIGFIIGNVTTVIVIFYLLIKKVGIKPTKGSISKQYLKSSINYGFKAYVSNLMTFLNYRQSIFILGFIVSPAAVGIYTVAINIGERITMVATAISSVLFPKIAAEDSEEERNRVTSIVSRNVLILTIFASIILYLISDLFIRLFFGLQYAESSPLVKILLLGIIFLSIEKLYSNDIAGRGRPGVNMYVSIVNVILNLILNILLIPKYGAVGAAWSTSITYFISFIVKIIIFKKISGQSFYQLLIIQKQDIKMYKKFLNKIRRKKAFNV